MPGTVSFVLNGQEYTAMFDYEVRRSEQTAEDSRGIEFRAVDDTRYEVTYPNGDKQYLFLIQ